MNEKINITKMDGSKIAADIICFIENVKTGKRYVYYTLNEMVGDGANSTVKIYVSKVQQTNPALNTPITEEDWVTLKGYMADALKGVSNPDIKYVPLSEVGEPVSVSERAIAMPTSYDYINKQRGIYAQNVATVAVEPVTPVEPVQAPIDTLTPEVEQDNNVAIEPILETAPTATLEETTTVTNEPVVDSPLETPAVPSLEDTENADKTTGTSAILEPIDISMIEKKYDDMIASINKLKEQELEAVKRYNATIELSLMHNEQHANYVQSEQVKEANPADITIQAPEFQSTLNPIESMSTAQEQPISTPVEQIQPGPIPVANETVQEPTPVTPVVPEPIPATSMQDLETNWFDMPSNAA